MSSYRKPRRFRKGALATAVTLLACLTLSLVGIVAYYWATQGWEAIVGFFTGKWFALVAVVVLVALAAAGWLLFTAFTSKSLGGKDDG